MSVSDSMLRTIERITALGDTVSPRETIVGPSPNRDTSASTDDFLPLLRIAGEVEGPADIEIRGRLGEGGLGRVDLATQSVFGRDVAVKRVRRDHLGDAAAGALVREARTTGALDHPNIVPAYALGLTSEGPMLVMKRVQGVPWSTLIHDPEHPAWEGHVGDPLGRHLEILMQISNAVEFAHRRGVIHRDLKPENVMVGDLGEVYLLDWGLAIHLQEACDESPAGTPAYMAPESLTGAVSTRTDVYLLGGLLHELITGLPPHPGNSLQEVLLSVLEGQPYRYDASVPPELAALCARAMEHEPDARFQSALAFRLALGAFVEHRGSLDLSREGERNLEALTGLLADPERGDEARGLFAATDFAFRQALRVWPENQQARVGLQSCLEGMIAFEVKLKNAPGARALLGRLPAPRPHLEAQVQALQRALAAEAAAKAKLDWLGHEVDPRVSSNSRVGLALSFYAVVGLLFATLDSLRFALSAELLSAAFALTIVSYAFTLYILRSSLLNTQMNRRMHTSVGAALIWGALSTLLGGVAGLSIDVVVLFWLAGFGLCHVIIAIWMEPQIAGIAAMLILALFSTPILICAFWPGHAMSAMALASLSAIPTVFVRAWLRRRYRTGFV